MKKNMGSKDKLIRTIVALIITVLYFTGIITGTVAIALALVAIILLLTSFLNFCPIYKVLGMKTSKANE